MDVEEAAPSRPTNGIVAELEAEAQAEEENLAKKKQPRQQSQREEEWITALVEKYGNDTDKMAKDRRLNPMQQSEGDIKRRLRRWTENG